MLSWLAANAANILITVALLAVVVLIVRDMVRGRIKTCSCGGSSCSGDSCGSCPFCAGCHDKKSE